MFGSTAGWQLLRCCEFCSTSLKLKTVRMNLPSTLSMQAEVSVNYSIPVWSRHGCQSSWLKHSCVPVKQCISVDVSERVKLKRSDYPLALRVMQGPCEQVCKIFLMEEDLGEEVTYDVSNRCHCVRVSDVEGCFVIQHTDSKTSRSSLFFFLRCFVLVLQCLSARWRSILSLKCLCCRVL